MRRATRKRLPVRRRSSGRVLYNWHRYYDPSIGRYISADPIGQAGGVNVYQYAQNDPVNATDSLGLIAGVDDATAIVLAGLAAGTAAVYCHFAECGEAVADALEDAADAAALAATTIGAMCMGSEGGGEGDKPVPPPALPDDIQDALDQLEDIEASQAADRADKRNKDAAQIDSIDKSVQNLKKALRGLRGSKDLK